MLTTCSINIGNAAILGLKKVLHSQTGTEYNAALTFPPCLALPLEIPSYILVKN